MADALKPLPFDPTRIKGMSKKLILSHYENNDCGAVDRLNAIPPRSPNSISPRPRVLSSTA